MMSTRATRTSTVLAMLLLAAAILGLPTATQAQASNRSLALGTVEKGDNLRENQTVTFNIAATSGQRIIIGAIDVDAISIVHNPAKPPEVHVDCPTIPGVSSLRPPSGTTNDSRAVYCTPRSATTSSSAATVPVTVTLKGISEVPVNYAVFAEDLSNSTATTVNGLNFAGVNLNARRVNLYSLTNRDSTIVMRRLAFSAAGVGASRMAASLFREDGSLRCSTFGGQICTLYHPDYADYYVAIINAGDVPYTYTVTLTNP